MIVSFSTATFMKKVIIFFLLGLSAWTLTKVSYFIGFDARGTDYYDRLGIEGSINLVHWLHGDGGYHGTKLKSPAANFFLVHIFFGVSVLVLIALTLIRPTWRRKYGYFTFSFALLLGGHTLPAAFRSDITWMRWVFTITCLYTMLAALLGYNTLRLYDRNPTLCEKHLALEHHVIAFGAWGAGFAELFGIMNNIKEKNASSSGHWPETGDGPHPMAGHTVYDRLPEKVGFTIFAILVTVFWVVWPLWSIKPRSGSVDCDTSQAAPREGEASVIGVVCEEARESDAEQPLLVQHGSADDNSCCPKRQSTKMIQFSIRPEMCRFVAYLLFWAMCLCAKLVTTVITGPRLSVGPADGNTCPPFEPQGQGFDIDTNSHLYRKFGFNNMCVNWDYTPSREITAMVYPYFEYALLIYITLDFCNFCLSHQRGEVSAQFWTLAKVCFPAQIILCSWFRMIFVVVAYENVQGHTAGYLGMEIVLLSVAILNTFFCLEAKTDFLAGKSRRMAVAYLVGDLIIGSVKLYFTSFVVLFASYPAWAKGTGGQVVDCIWMLFNAIIPLLISYQRAKTQTPIVFSIK